MTQVHHLDCGRILPPGGGQAVCHCLLLEGPEGLVLVDTGLGLLDVRQPEQRLGQKLIDAVGLQLDEADTAWRRIESLGLDPRDVRQIVLTHADVDHAGGLSDFPQAEIHLSAEEHAGIESGRRRYRREQFAHQPRWSLHAEDDAEWFGMPARRLDLGLELQTLLVPLFGHTEGHCGVALERPDGRWFLHAGDAYYLRIELESDRHPVSILAAQRAVDNAGRLASLERLRRLLAERAGEIELFSSHDRREWRRLARRSASSPSGSGGNS